MFLPEVLASSKASARSAGGSGCGVGSELSKERALRKGHWTKDNKYSHHLCRPTGRSGTPASPQALLLPVCVLVLGWEPRPLTSLLTAAGGLHAGAGGGKSRKQKMKQSLVGSLGCSLGTFFQALPTGVSGRLDIRGQGS